MVWKVKELENCSLAIIRKEFTAIFYLSQETRSEAKRLSLESTRDDIINRTIFILFHINGGVNAPKGTDRS